VLLANGASAAPVVVYDEDEVDMQQQQQQRPPRLVGVISSFDFLQKEAFEGALLPMEGSASDIETYVRAARKICGRRVADLMSATTIADGDDDDEISSSSGDDGGEDNEGNSKNKNKLLTIGPDASMRDAAAIMASGRIHRLPVVLADDGSGGGGEKGRGRPPILLGLLTSDDVMRDVFNVVKDLPPARSSMQEGDRNSKLEP